MQVTDAREVLYQDPGHPLASAHALSCRIGTFPQPRRQFAKSASVVVLSSPPGPQAHRQPIGMPQHSLNQCQTVINTSNDNCSHFFGVMSQKLQGGKT